MSEPMINPSGPLDAAILIVGEYPGADEFWKGVPFQGASGLELSRMLHETGIIVSACRLAYVYPWKTSGAPAIMASSKEKGKAIGATETLHNQYCVPRLLEGLAKIEQEIQTCKPKIIITLGELALWALTGENSITNWRGSHLEHPASSTRLIPTFTPQMILRNWDWRVFMVRDLGRAFDYVKNPEVYNPVWNFTIRPDYNTVMKLLRHFEATANHLQQAQAPALVLSLDIETICRHISCLGIAWNASEALCIPFMAQGKHYWEEHEEIAIIQKLKTVLTHPHIQCVGQNFAGYDNQHFAKHWGFVPNLTFDTMLAQHTLYPGMAKSLDVLSSLYCHYHRYWKDELKDYNKMPADIHQYWTYNCKDCVITYEIYQVLQTQLEKAKLMEQFTFLMRMATRNVFRAMLRGIRIQATRRSEVAGALLKAIEERETLLHHIVDFPLNTGSPKQMKEFFYEDLGLPPIKNRKTKKPTCDSIALATIAQKFPLLKPLTDLIEEKRSLGVFLSTFCLMSLDTDGRMRCSYNVAGTETFRLSSSENAFGSGGNLQNVPKGEEE